MSSSLPAGARLGRYEIKSRIGAGGMGEVYLAEDTRLHRKVALKVLPANIASKQGPVQRFVQEAKAASALNHPNIITIHEIEEIDSLHFIATEFIDGETLRERMRQSSIKLSEVLEVATQVASALAAAHAAGIVHRDIKPENIMLRRDGFVKVVDFGLAKLIEASSTMVDTEAPTKAMIQTEPGVVMGTVAYMSPEQVRGLGVDARTDIWSLGVVLYEMTSGHAPFAGETSNHISVSILEDGPAPLARYAPEVPSELQRIVRKTLAKDRDERYQTARDLLIDLKTLRRELDIQSEIEQSIAPSATPSGTIATNEDQASQETTRGSATQATSVAESRPTSSAEYLVSRIKLRRRTIIVVVLALAGLLVLVGINYFGKGNKPAINSIAVLPFVNVGGDANTEYLTDGVTESLIDSLSKLPNLAVKSRSSVFRYKGQEIDPMRVASELGVEAVLTGRLVQRGDALSMNLELVDARNNNHIWGEQYNRKSTDILVVQEEIVKEVLEKLRLRLAGEEEKRATKRYTENTEAYQLYLHGRYYWNKRTKENITKSIGYYEKAIEKDPGYALAYAGLADSYIVGAAEFPPTEKYPKTKAAARKALEIDSTLAEPHAALARAIFEYDWDFACAEKEYQQAIVMDSNYATAHQFYALFLSAMGRSEEALREALRAETLDPLAISPNAALGFVHFYARRYDQAIAQFKKTIELDQNYAIARRALVEAYELKGMNDEAVTETLKGLTLSGEKPETVAALRASYTTSGVKGFWRKRLDMLIEGSKQSYVSPVTIAQICARLDEKDKVFEWLEKGYREHDGRLVLLNVIPEFDSLRSDQRFTDLVRRVGF